MTRASVVTRERLAAAKRARSPMIITAVSVAVPRSFPKGTRVFHEGDHSDACYIVRTGSFRVTREHPDGRAITLANLASGDIFGELAMLDGEVRSASVEALSDGELLALPAGEVRALLARHPEITVKLIAALVRRLRTANERISRRGSQPAFLAYSSQNGLPVAGLKCQSTTSRTHTSSASREVLTRDTSGMLVGLGETCICVWTVFRV